jgi:3,4-dihydroxy 2-butanone 4-phosphate synthase/GTP cyclohydrolase II
MKKPPVKPRNAPQKRASNKGIKSSAFDSIADVIEEIRRGRMVIVTDDEDRENEGDLVMAASKVTPQAVNFMATHGRGLICVPITEDWAAHLGLQRMVAHNRELHATDFTVSVDASHGTTTGISARDRAATIKVLANPTAGSKDLRQPGHIFPLQAAEGGVLKRAGHTEAGVDLARLAGLDPSGVICEILNEDGSMARLPDLLKFKKKHGLKICSIRDLIAYRRKSEKLVLREQEIEMPTDFGDFKMFLYRAEVDNHHHLAMVKGPIDPKKPALVRVCLALLKMLPR